jgi:hypothetical protein
MQWLVYTRPKGTARNPTIVDWEASYLAPFDFQGIWCFSRRSIAYLMGITTASPTRLVARSDEATHPGSFISRS